jgi:hypothetical protein
VPGPRKTHPEMFVDYETIQDAISCAQSTRSVMHAWIGGRAYRVYPERYERRPTKTKFSSRNYKELSCDNREAVHERTAKNDRSLSRGQELSWRAWEERGCRVFVILRRVFWPLGPRFLFDIEPDFHLLS